MELRLEALDVAKNWIMNHLIPVPLIQSHLLRPIMSYVVDFSQQVRACTCGKHLDGPH